MKIGIDAINYYVPKTYLPIADLAEARGIEYAKLNKGLGLEKMAIPDINEDVASMAAQAVLRLIKQAEINPLQIGRMYLGTESALDAAKPTATYVANMVENAMQSAYGPRVLKNCDVVDMTFACIGAVDALENAMDWVRAEPSRKAIVIAADMAKYERNSTGEYTQGAGAVAVLVTANPRILAINPKIGVALESVSDFYKPRRTFAKLDLLKSAAKLLGQKLDDEELNLLLANAEHPFWGELGHTIEIHREEPVFDGPYSNTCYQSRIFEALEAFRNVQPMNVLERWQKLVFHLPYAFQGRRMITPNWITWMRESGREAVLAEALESLNATEADAATQTKVLAKSDLYKNFVANYIAQGEVASSQIGNMYTASIFMSLLSLLAKAIDDAEDLVGKNIGFFAYGSGSKSKVFEGEVQAGWIQALAGLNLFAELQNRTPISFADYEAWHTGAQSKPFISVDELRLNRIGDEGVTLGYRYYS